ncbi:MAG: 23S rRNA (uracil(1939)-C(5))-methyltransferase RlmD, partial [Proteobacteria bacterium]|nr:23S rRNA (uracil(1939)-C(5))-methyltransferase RlmD [Pseudomonadota bacterium]
MEKIIDLKIDKIIYNGYSIGKYNGITIFTRWGVPGDTVKVKITEKKKNYYSGQIVSIVNKSKSRIEAPCPYFGKCGGCQLQNIRYADQIKIKENFVRESITRYKSTKKINISPIIGTNNVFKYRNKAQLPVKNGHIGFYSINSHEIVDLKEGCIIQEDTISENIRILNEIARSGELSKHIPHIVLRKDIGGVYLIFVTDRLMEEFPIIKKLKNITGVYQSIKGIRSNRIMGDRFIHYGGEKFLKVRYFNEIYDVYPWSFLQVNDEMAEKLYEKAIEYIKPNEKSVVLDGYSGVGILSMMIAKKAKTVFAVEYDPMSVVSLGMNMQKKGIENIRPFQG